MSQVVSEIESDRKIIEEYKEQLLDQNWGVKKL